MRKWLNKAKGLPIILVVLFLVFAGTAIAVTYLHVVSVSVTVSEGVQDVAVYSDAAGINEVNSLNISNLETNQAWVETVYVKNNGLSSVTVGMAAEGNTAFGLVMFNPSGLFTLLPAESMPVEVSIYALPDALAGVYNFSLIVHD